MSTEQVTVDQPWRFKRVEKGTARVIDRKTGRDVGYVVRHYFGWGAYSFTKHRLNTIDYQTRIQAAIDVWKAAT